MALNDSGSIQQRTLELIARGAPLETVLDALCDGIDAVDPNLLTRIACLEVTLLDQVTCRRI